jgi:hypothetical protein
MAEDSEFASWQVQENFLFSTASKLDLLPTWSLIQWVQGALSLGRVKWLGHEADHSPPSNAEVKNMSNFTFTSPYISYGMALNQAQEQLYFL